MTAALVVQGCAGGVSSSDLGDYHNKLATGDYPGAEKAAVGAGKIGADGSSDNLLWSLNAGSAMIYDGSSGKAGPVLDHAEEMMKKRDLSFTAGPGQYHAKTYDGVMTNTYKAVAAMQGGQSDQARTELLRAEDRQSRAEQDFQAEIAEANAKQPDSSFDMSSAMSSTEANADYRQANIDMRNYGAYQPFINPFATYLAGLYFLNTADHDPERARNAFSRVRGIIGAGPLISGDYDLAAKGTVPSPKTWVIFENGRSSTLTQYNITFPVPIVGRRTGVSVATVAMPRLAESSEATPGLLVGEGRVRTTVIGNFDYVMRSEFQRRYPSILRVALLEAATKIVLQNVAAQEKTGIALLVTTVASNVSTADTRSWTALPKNFQAARIEAPKDGVVVLRDDSGRSIGTANVPATTSSIVYVRMMQPGSPASIQVLKF